MIFAYTNYHILLLYRYLDSVGKHCFRRFAYTFSLFQSRNRLLIISKLLFIRLFLYNIDGRNNLFPTEKQIVSYWETKCFSVGNVLETVS